MVINKVFATCGRAQFCSFPHYFSLQQIFYQFYKQPSMTIITYNLDSYDDICKDVAARSKIMFDFKSIIERRIRIQHDHLTKLRQLTCLPEMRRVHHPIKTTQILLNSLINSIHSQVENVSNHLNRMQTQIGKKLGSHCFELDTESKREIINSSLIIKDYEKRCEEIEKQRLKVLKKSGELKKLKQQYIIGTLIDMSFDKKNKLFIKTKEIQQSYKPLHEEFEINARIFNEKALSVADKLKQIFTKITKTESEKVQIMKESFMILQISNSEFGANIIQEKGSVISRVNSLCNTNPDFKFFDPEEFQRLKSQMCLPQYDPCSYINNLYTNIVDTKNMHSLVIYGHEIKHRESISECMINSPELALGQSNQQFANVKEIARCFNNIFNDKVQFRPESLERLQQLIENSTEARKNFILCLQKYRTISKFDISEKKICPIEKILNAFLTKCMKQLDTYNSKLLLVLSFTYHVEIEGKKVDLHTYIQGHQIWKDKQWWQSALLESSYQQLKIKPKKQQEPPITIWHIKGSGFKNGESEHQMTSQNILFNQLTFYLHNMRLFEIRQEIITYIGRKYSRYFQFNQKFNSDIEAIIKIQQSIPEETQLEAGSIVNSPLCFKRKSSGPSRKLFSRNN